MAGKKQALTPEEKLARALVPQDQQPYTLPKGWVWTKLENIAKLITGNTPSKKEQTYYGNDVPFYKPADLDAGRHVCTPSEYLSKKGAAVGRLIPTGATSVCCIGSIGKCGFIENPGCTNQQITSVIPYFNNLYIYYLCQSPLFQTELIEKSSSTTISIVNKAKMGKCIIPLPPLPEQQRIVARIESLFAKLDAARDKLQQVLDTQEARRAAILHEAFTGRLTGHKGSAECRGKREEEKSQNPEGTEFVPEGWRIVTLGDLITNVEAGKNMRCIETPPSLDKFGIVKVSAATWGTFKEDESKTCIEGTEWNPDVQIKPGDFLLSRANTIQLVGNCVIVEKITRHLMLSDKILRVSFDEQVNPYFILFFTQSLSYRNQITKLASGNQDGMRNISQKNLKLIQLALPPLDEQNKIVTIVKREFKELDMIKDKVSKSCNSIIVLKKSSLARAFRGQLGTQDSSDPDARDLLTSDQ